MQKQFDVSVRLLREKDLPTADRIVRLAFGTFLGLPEPIKFMGDADYVRTRWLADPFAAIGAESGGEIVGSNFATRWGSVGFFGPLTIRPDLWDRGIAQQLLRPTMDLFEKWGVRHAGLFTFASSTKHVSLYQKFGFWPRYLTALMEIPVPAEAVPGPRRWARFSDLSIGDKELCIQACTKLTNSIYEGLDVQREIRAVDNQRLGDTVLTWGGGELTGFAVCHAGPGTEAGSGKCLLEACVEFARARGTKTLSGGVNLSRLDAYQEMLEMGFHTTNQGVVMEQNGAPGYNRPEVFLIDDWR
jgi:GNAT superfamily N-acetyltransferase